MVPKHDFPTSSQLDDGLGLEGGDGQGDDCHPCDGLTVTVGVDCSLVVDSDLLVAFVCR